MSGFFAEGSGQDGADQGGQQDVSDCDDYADQADAGEQRVQEGIESPAVFFFFINQNGDEHGVNSHSDQTGQQDGNGQGQVICIEQPTGAVVHGDGYCCQ